MKLPLPNILHCLDRHWLLNHPVLWIMRLHWMVYFWLLGLLLFCMVALVLPVSLPNVRSLNTYFWASLALAGLAVSPWFYLQARFAPQLRQNAKARTAVYLLAGYLFILGIHLVWPYSFVLILESRISLKIDESEVRNDFHTLNYQTYSREELQKLILRYQKTGTVLIRIDEIYDAIIWSAAIKGVHLKGVPSNYEPRDYYGWGWRVVPQIVLLLALFLRIFQMTDAKSMLMILLFGSAMWIALVVYDSSDFSGQADDVVFGLLLFLFAVGGCTALLASRLKRKSALLVGFLNVFTLLLTWMPYFFLSLSIDGPHPDERYIVAIFLGIIMLFAVTPWIQSIYLALHSKPS